ncbi:hypothetical protein ALC56_07317, partial [Trachymyrmex septentrionalis]
SIFSTHSTRHASISLAANKGVSSDEIRDRYNRNTSLEYSFARGAEACTNDRATICSFKTKNIDRARKRREGLEERLPVPVEETSTEEEEQQLGCSGSPLCLENTLKLFGERPSQNQHDRD